jgi:hypothetical protein
MYFKVVQPGYAIAKRRSGINVTLNMDELWAGASKVNIIKTAIFYQEYLSTKARHKAVL